MPYDRYIDPLVAALAIVGAAHLLTHAMRAGRVLLAVGARVRRWWSWRVFLARHVPRGGGVMTVLAIGMRLNGVWVIRTRLVPA